MSTLELLLFDNFLVCLHQQGSHLKYLVQRVQWTCVNVTLSFPVQWKKKTDAPSMPLMRVKVPYMAGFCSYEARVPVRKLANTCDWSGEVT